MDYEKNKEALAIVKQMVADGQVAQDVAEKYFPELKESEDERIINRIKKAVEEYWSDEPLDEILAWLEKQAGHANFRNKIQIGDKVTRNEDGVLVNLSQLKRVAKKDEKQGEQKLDKVEPKFNVGDKVKSIIDGFVCTIESIDNTCYYGDTTNFDIQDQDGWELVEQNPAWSEKDEEIIEKCIGAVRHSCYSHSTKTKAEDWLKDLKDRVQPQPKQWWSEEDENHVKSILSTIECCKAQFPNAQAVVEAYNADIDWLKSLRPQPTWKPSEEMLEALYRAIPKNVMEISEDEMLLDKLYQGLKYGKVLGNK